MSGKVPGHVSIDLAERDVAGKYHFLVSAIVPRPIAWVATRGRDGSTNLAPFSYFQGVCSDPPTLSISIARTKRSGERKDTLRNIEETGEFVVHVIDESLLEPMVASAEELPAGASEIERLDLEIVPGERVAAPVLVGAPLAFECRRTHQVSVGRCELVIGEILLVHAREDVLDARGNVDPERLRPLGRLGGRLFVPWTPGRTVEHPPRR